MDDIFQILIYVFIIFTFLASLFKKKKQQDNKNETTFKSVPQPGMETKTSQHEEYDILKEIERMFKQNVPPPEKEETLQEENSYKTTSEHLRTEDWMQSTQQEHKTTHSEHTYESWDEKKSKTEKSRKAVNEKIVQQAAMFEKHVARTSGEKSDIKKSIMQKFKEPASLREYIIFSEIIGKPKALQE